MKGSTPKKRGEELNKVIKKIYDPYGKEVNVIDLLTDIRHVCDRYGWNFADLDRQAYQHYIAESGYVPPVQPAKSGQLCECTECDWVNIMNDK